MDKVNKVHAPVGAQEKPNKWKGCKNTLPLWEKKAYNHPRRRGVQTVIEQGHSNQEISSLRSPFRIDMRGALIKTTPLEDEERI
ncbi:MAG: hypothetical protein EZS28_008131 [Streblomastix strix]|uniref:Uncharacterized protein n=1 Tax=Streblomastix strix TaxID=222440 RepID=A0A5J4WP31_9EUKA|nr:MAG: hypothetical protein EZS28_008131 [Streblomastix strix]